MLALRHRKDAESGAAVRRYALSLGHDSSTTFSKAIKHFLTCTLEGSEREAAVVVRNVRQFMSGMKNYLVTSGEGEFEAIVTRERSTVSCVLVNDKWNTVNLFSINIKEKIETITIFNIDL